MLEQGAEGGGGREEVRWNRKQRGEGRGEGGRIK